MVWTIVPAQLWKKKPTYSKKNITFTEISVYPWSR